VWHSRIAKAIARVGSQKERVRKKYGSESVNDEELYKDPLEARWRVRDRIRCEIVAQLLATRNQTSD
jgi:hypothetical protein